MAFLAPLAGVAASASGATAVGMGVASTGLGLIGTGISAYSSLKAGKAAQAEANFVADQQVEQSVTASYNAKLSQENTAREVQELRDIRTRNLAAQAAAVAGSGIRLSGSAVDVMRDTTLEAEKAIALAKWRGSIETYNYGMESRSLLTSSAYTRAAGANAKRSSRTAAIATVFDGASRAGSNYFSLYNSTRA